VQKIHTETKLTNQDGKQLQVGDLLGQPLALSFIYTRCTNPNKCARVSSSMSRLQADLEQLGLASKVRLVLITYDSEFDTPEILKSYGTRFGLGFTTNAMMLRLEPKDKQQFLDDLQVAVNFNRTGVNIHGIQLFLFDRHGKMARTYHTLIWDNAAVLQDLRRLVAEPH
jgi:cytochrome oxidase Cu insertion factor (SCO1/SenC/PrrC family)